MSFGTTRRQFIKQLSAAGATTALAACGFEDVSQAPLRQPNILVIVTDDQAVSALGASGRFGFLQTPHMDRLAGDGATFRNSFVTTSLCAPSRASMLTGCYAHRHGLRTFMPEHLLDPSLPLFTELLQQVGYETAHIGKWHLRNGGEEPGRGLDYAVTLIGQGRYQDPVLDDNGSQIVASGYVTDVLTDYAVSWLQRPRSKPGCLVVSHKAAHQPFTPAARHADAFSGVPLPEPPSWSDDYRGKPEWLRRALIHGVFTADWQRSEGQLIPEAVPAAPWQPNNPIFVGYLRSLLAVDDSLGRLLAAVEQGGMLDDTIVVFTSDNGFFQGEHRLGDKRLMYEESIRVPLLVRYPRRILPNTDIDGMTLNIDLAPTLLELAGAQIPERMQGASWLPLLDGDDEGWRRSFLYEYFLENSVPGRPTIAGIRTEQHKLVTTPDLPDEIDELYDVAADPYELTNLIDDAAYAQVRDELEEELASKRPPS